MKRKHKKYSKPKRPFDKQRIEEEAKIKEEFGLKNKKEIWKADAKINSFRERAKKLVTATPEDQKKLLDRLNKIGLKVASLADVLSLEAKDYLNRRLQTVLVKKKLANTAKMARQLITHKKVLVGGEVVNKPSYIVDVELENKISIKPGKVKPKKVEEKKEEAKPEEKIEETEEKQNE